MNVLIHSNHIFRHLNKLALVPFNELLKYDLDLMNGAGYNFDDVNELADRLGLVFQEKDNKEFFTNCDLKKYIDPIPPFQVDKIIIIYPR